MTEAASTHKDHLMDLVRVLMETLWMPCLASAFAAKMIGEKIDSESRPGAFLFVPTFAKSTA